MDWEVWWNMSAVGTQIPLWCKIHLTDFHRIIDSLTEWFGFIKKYFFNVPQVWFVSIFPTSVHSCSGRKRNAVLLYKETSFICTKLPPRLCREQKTLNVMAVRVQGKTSETPSFCLCNTLRAFLGTNSVHLFPKLQKRTCRGIHGPCTPK